MNVPHWKLKLIEPRLVGRRSREMKGLLAKCVGERLGCWCFRFSLRPGSPTFSESGCLIDEPPGARRWTERAGRAYSWPNHPRRPPDKEASCPPFGRQGHRRRLPTWQASLACRECPTRTRCIRPLRGGASIVRPSSPTLSDFVPFFASRIQSRENPGDGRR